MQVLGEHHVMNAVAAIAIVLPVLTGLWIDGVRVIDNGGLHGAIPKIGDIALAIGCHDLDVRMFESVGSEALALRWRLPMTTQFAEIPLEAFRSKR